MFLLELLLLTKLVSILLNNNSGLSTEVIGLLLLEATNELAALTLVVRVRWLQAMADGAETFQPLML